LREVCQLILIGLTHARAGTREARRLQALTLANVNVLDYVTTGRSAAGGWILQVLRARA
jgi:hypothetical protein